MMKRINTISAYHSEKKRLHHQEADLENKIRHDWEAVKVSLKPTSLIKESFKSIAASEQQEDLKKDSILKSTLLFGINLLARKFADKASDKIDRMFK